MAFVLLKGFFFLLVGAISKRREQRKKKGEARPSKLGCRVSKEEGVSFHFSVLASKKKRGWSDFVFSRQARKARRVGSFVNITSSFP